MNNLLQQDTYQVYCKGFLGEDKSCALTLLYQPLARAEAFALYMTLYHEVERSRVLNTPSTHYRLCQICQMDLQRLQDSLASLEGLGLLKSYRKKDGRQADYIYELLMPLTPKRFFSNELLNTLLYRTLGEVDYEKTKYYFTCPEIDAEHYENITYRFDEVFHIDLNGTDILKKRQALIDDANKEPALQYDLDLFYRGLQDYQIPRKAITPDIEKAIIQYGTIYHIAPTVMRELVYDVYDQQRISLDDLKERCLRYYEFEHQSQPQMVMKSDEKKNQPAAKSKRDQKIQQLSTLSPYEYLRALQNGTNPTARDLSLIEKVLTEQKLKPGVVNVLIETVIQLNQGELPRNHLEYLAGMFARKGIDNVEKAMKEAKAYIASRQKKTPVDLPAVKDKTQVPKQNVDEKEYDALKREIEAMLKGGQM